MTSTPRDVGAAIAFARSSLSRMRIHVASSIGESAALLVAINVVLGCSGAKLRADTSTAPSAARSNAECPVASSLELTRLDVESRLGAYAARDAVWVPGKPLLVSSEYDMAFAMALEAGPALAAVKR